MLKILVILILTKSLLVFADLSRDIDGVVTAYTKIKTPAELVDTYFSKLSFSDRQYLHEVIMSQSTQFLPTLNRDHDDLILKSRTQEVRLKILDLEKGLIVVNGHDVNFKSVSKKDIRSQIRYLTRVIQFKAVTLFDFLMQSKVFAEDNDALTIPLATVGKKLVDLGYAERIVRAGEFSFNNARQGGVLSLELACKEIQEANVLESCYGLLSPARDVLRVSYVYTNGKNQSRRDFYWVSDQSKVLDTGRAEGIDKMLSFTSNDGANPGSLSQRCSGNETWAEADFGTQKTKPTDRKLKPIDPTFSKELKEAVLECCSPTGFRSALRKVKAKVGGAGSCQEELKNFAGEKTSPAINKILPANVH